MSNTGLPGDYETTTTTTAGPAVSGAGWVPPTAGSGQAAPPGPGSATAWGKYYTSRAAQQQRYYDASTGSYSRLRDRLFDFRSRYAQSGDANLDNVMDYYLRETADYRAPGSKRAPQTVASWLERFRLGKSDYLSQWQQKLWDAGYYAPDVYKNPELLRRGKYDPYTQDAATRLFKDGVMMGLPLDQLLREGKDSFDAAGGVRGRANAEKEPFTATVSAPDTIRSAGQNVSVQMTGRRQDDFAEGLIKPLQAQEVAADRAAYDDASRVTQAPDPGSFAEQELYRTQGAEVGAYSYLQNFNALLERLGLG